MIPEGEPPAAARRFAQMFLEVQGMNYHALYSRVPAAKSLCPAMPVKKQSRFCSLGKGRAWF
jgi:hypothetical protein